MSKVSSSTSCAGLSGYDAPNGAFQNGPLRWQDILDGVSACVVAAVDPLGRGCIEAENGIGGQRVDDVVDTVGRA
jgi:hypothetical protein